MSLSARNRLVERLDAGRTIDVRGHGKAGGGLVLAIQAFGEALGADPDLDVQDWPLFSSARKGATVCAYLRVARRAVEDASRVRRPDIAVLMNEAAAADVDFAEGTDEALFVINTNIAPEAAAQRWRLGGTVVTVAGDALGLEYLGRPLANVPVLAALVQASGLVPVAAVRDSLRHRLEKRRLPQRIVDANLGLFDAALGASRSIEVPTREGAHPQALFRGYGELPAGAQSHLRTSRANATASYGRPSVRVEFSDPMARCNACSLCVVQCPDGLVLFEPTEGGALVHGARFETHCKRCRECISACPLDLFREVAVVAPGDGSLEET